MDPQEPKRTQDSLSEIEEQQDSESVESEENSIPFEIEQINEDGSIYSTLNDEKSQIRLLYINPESCGQGCDGDSIICTDLYKVSLDDAPDYAALSYVWGDAKDTTKICLGGRITPVTKNLANALTRLREMPQDYFWADAICINQGDIDERGQQVQLMEDIYSGASLVYAWLNAEKADEKPKHEIPSIDTSEPSVSPRLMSASTWPLEFEETDQSSAQSKSVMALDLAIRPPSPTDVDDETVMHNDSPDGLGGGEEEEKEDSERPEQPELVEVPTKIAENRVDTGLFWCNMIFEQLEASKAQSTEAIKDAPKIRRCEGMTVLVNDAVFPVLDLLKNKYWSRVWIFQEMVLADEITFLGPNTSLELSQFQAVCSWLREVGDGDVLRPSFVEHSVWSEWKKPIQLADMMPLKIKRCKAMVEKIDRSKPKASLAKAREEVFSVTRRMNATDPHDHIYGILGVLDVRFRPDYRRSIEDLYIAWAYWLAFSKPDLSFLNQAGFGQNKEHGYALPSWVPDWSSILNLRYGKSSLYADDKMMGQIKIIKKTILIADGVEVSEVVPRRSNGRNMWLKTYNHLLSNGHPTGDPPLQVLFRTLVSDNSNADACKNGKFDHHNPKLLREFISFATLLMSTDDEAFHLIEKDLLAWNPVSWAVNEYFGLPPRPANSLEDRWNPLVSLYNGNDDFLEKGPDTGDAIVDGMLREVLNLSLETFELLGDDDNIMSILLENALLFRTRDGHVGRSGADVQAGDKVCVLAGCRNPLVLRPVEDHFVIVEPCFVHGLMYGQAMQGVNEGRYEMRKFEIH